MSAPPHIPRDELAARWQEAASHLPEIRRLGQDTARAFQDLSRDGDAPEIFALAGEIARAIAEGGRP